MIDGHGPVVNKINVSGDKNHESQDLCLHGYSCFYRETRSKTRELGLTLYSTLMDPEQEPWSRDNEAEITCPDVNTMSKMETSTDQ